MSQKLQLDTLVTMLACLTTTQNELDVTSSGMLPPIDNTTAGCPVTALSSLTGRMQTIATDIADLHEQMGSLQEQLADLRRQGPIRGIAPSPILPTSIGSRFLDLETPQIAAGAGTKEPATPHNCLKQQHGVVRIRPRSNVEPFFVFCDQKTRGGGWTVVANRHEGTEDFNRKWADYKIGFGPLNTEFFLGLDKLHQICSSDNYELLIVLQNRKQEQRYALYDQFSIGSETERYRLNVLGNYTGDASDALRQHVGKKFSTQDQNNGEGDSNCAVAQSAAFWYASACSLSNLFGLYQRLLERDVDGYKGILWRGFQDGPKGSLKVMRMLVRPRGV